MPKEQTNPWSEENVDESTQTAEALNSAVEKLLKGYAAGDGFHHVGLCPYPSRQDVIQSLQQVRRILFPGYFAHIEQDCLQTYLLEEIQEFFDQICSQIVLSFQHDCLRSAMPCGACMGHGQDLAREFIDSLPGIGAAINTDVRAALEGDPAAKSYDEVICCYPGLTAVTAYRLAHRLHVLGVPILPRMMTEYAHSRTGIDIHPGAGIGESFFIDHGTGVVVGETTEIGRRVRLYQGVTLGALSVPQDAGSLLRSRKRHPTIEDDVIIYANATILGEKAVIGARSIIGGNVWITEPVPPDSKVMLRRPDLTYSIKNSSEEG